MSVYRAIRVGPRDRGRSYGVLEHSLDAADFARFRPVLEDFSLALAAWADLGLRGFVALMPLEDGPGGWVLWRARFLGAGDLGTIAVAHGLLISPGQMEDLEGRAHRLLSGLAEPDGGPFGSRSISAQAPRPTVTPIPAFGLEWCDHVVEILDGADPETVLIAALEGVSPAVQIGRIAGWATTGALQSSSAFDPDASFGLVVRPRGEPEGTALSGRCRVQCAGGRVVTPPQAEPPVWRAWTLVDRVAASFAAQAMSAWKSAYGTMPPDRVATLALLQNAAGLGPEERLDLIAAVVAETEKQPDLVEPISVAAGQNLIRLAATSDSDRDAALYLRAGLTESRFGIGVAREIAMSAPIDPMLVSLDTAALERAVDHGLLDRLAGGDADLALRGFNSEALTMMLGKSLTGAAAVASMRALAVDLIARLSGSDALSRRYAAAGISALIAMPIHAHDCGLATSDVARLVLDHPRIDQAGYATHALRPVLRGEVRLPRPAFIDAMRAVTRILEPAA